MHTVYEGKKYDLTLGHERFRGTRDQSRLCGTIYPKKNGERVGRHVNFYVGCAHLGQKHGKRRWLTKIECSEEPIVTKKPHKLRLEGEFDDEIGLLPELA